MKKAILVVSFGTSYKETREKTIEVCEKQIAEAFEGYDFFRAYTSNMIIKKIAQVENISIDNPKEALDKLYALGYEEVIVQSLHIICGEEYNKLKEEVQGYKEKFKRIELGRPLLTRIEDYKAAVEAIKYQLIDIKEAEAVVLMGHGTAHEAHSAYCAFEYMLEQENLRVYIGTVEGYPELSEVISKLEKNNIKKVYLMPFMLVAGDHAINDMAGEEEDSWKTLLEEAGYEVEIILKGLGENPKIRERFVIHAKECVSK